jgi:caffeoyl-CoA O-methyltransferase
MLLPQPVADYLAGLAPPTDPVILDMERSGRERGFPIIGPEIGRLCELLARAVGAKRVFEMGSGFGYSTWWFARAVGEGGLVVHTDGSAERSEEARGHLTRAGLVDRVDFRVGDARDLLRADPGPHDVVFNDIDKDGYPEALALARERVRPGGLILCDNTLWSGRVAEPDPDAWTEAIQAYNRAAHEAADLLSFIVPVRDGLSVSLKL